MTTPQLRTNYALLMLCACSLPQPHDPVREAMEKTNVPAMANDLMAAMVAPDTYANARYLTPKTLCAGSVRPHPVVMAGAAGQREVEVQPGPVVDAEYRIVFWTSADAKQTTVPDGVWLVVGHDDAWQPKAIPEWPGCWQMVNPDLMLQIGVAIGWQGMVKREPGRDSRVEVRWTPPAGMIGQKVQLQMLVYSPGSTPSGFNLSRAVELTVGTR